jgi:hypothetical protein
MTHADLNISALFQEYARHGKAVAECIFSMNNNSIGTTRVAWPGGSVIDEIIGKYQKSEYIFREEFERIIKISRTVLGAEPLEIAIFERLVSRAGENFVSDVLRELFYLLPKKYALTALGRPERVKEHQADRFPEKICREVWVEKGHEGRAGRLDLLVDYGDNEPIVIETKLYDCDLGKNNGYSESLRKQGVNFTGIAIVLDENANGNGFELRNWHDFLISLRHCIASLRKQNFNHIKIALLLAIVGGLEQSILRLSMDERKPSPRVISYLQNFTNEVSYGACF